MAGKNKVYITLEVDDKGSAVVRSFGNKTDKAFDKMKAKARGTSVSMGSSLQKLKQHWKVYSAAVIAGATIAIYALKRLIDSTAQTGDQFHKMSLRVGITTEKLSALGYAAQISGTDIGTVEKSLRYVSKVMVDFSMGVGEAKKTFEALGLTVVDANGKMKGTADFLVEVADKFKNMTDETKMAAYASEIFGARAGTQLLPLLKLGSKGIEDLMQKARELGIVMSTEDAAKAAEFTDAMTDLKGALEGVKRTIGTELLPTLKGYAEKTTEWIKQNKELIKQKVPEYLDKIKTSLDSIISTYNALPDGVVGAAGTGIIASMIFGPQVGAVIASLYLVNVQLNKINLGFNNLAGNAVGLSENFKNLWGVMTGELDPNTGLPKGMFAGGSVGKISGATRGWSDAIDKVADSTKGATDKTKELTATQKKAAEDAKKLLADFSDKYQQLTLGDYKYAVKKIEEQGEAYKVAGAKRLQVEAWASAEIQKLNAKTHNTLFAFETKMSQIRDNSSIRQLEFLGKQSEALDLQIQQRALLAERQYQTAITMPGVSDEDKLAATTAFLEAEYQLQAEYAQRKAELWWNSAQTYINFAQQMSTFAMQYLLAEGADREAIGRRMLATSIRFMTQGLQQFMFTKAKEHLINAFSAVGYIKIRTTQAAAEMTIGAQMAAAWAAYFAAMSMNPLGGQAFIPAAVAMAAATAGFGMAAAGVVTTGAASIAAELGMATAWAAGGVLIGAAGEVAASAIEGGGPGGEKTIGGGTGEGYTLSSPSEPQWQRQTAPVEPSPVSRTVNIHIYGDVVDHDKFAREIVPSIQKAIDDGVH